jgi:hypothetical protein
MPRDNSYPPDLAKIDPLVMEAVKLPVSVLEALTVRGLLEQRYRSYIIREVLTEYAAKYRRSLGAEYGPLVRQVRKKAPGRTAQTKTKQIKKETV